MVVIVITGAVSDAGVVGEVVAVVAVMVVVGLFVVFVGTVPLVAGVAEELLWLILGELGVLLLKTLWALV